MKLGKTGFKVLQRGSKNCLKDNLKAPWRSMLPDSKVNIYDERQLTFDRIQNWDAIGISIVPKTK